MTVKELQAALRQLAEVNVYQPEQLRQLRERLKALANMDIDDPPITPDGDGA